MHHPNYLIVVGEVAAVDRRRLADRALLHRAQPGAAHEPGELHVVPAPSSARAAAIQARPAPLPAGGVCGHLVLQLDTWSLRVP